MNFSKTFTIIISILLCFVVRVGASQTDVRMIPVMEHYDGLAETAAYSTHLTALNHFEQSSYQRYASFNLSRFENLERVLKDQKINTPFIWRNQTYMKGGSDGQIYHISNQEIRRYFKTPKGVVYVDEQGEGILYDYSNYKFYQFDLGGLEPSRMRLHRLTEGRLGIVSTLQASSAGGESAHLLVIDLENQIVQNMDPNYGKDNINSFFSDGCRQFLETQLSGYSGYYYFETLLADPCVGTVIQGLNTKELKFPQLLPEGYQWSVLQPKVSESSDYDNNPVALQNRYSFENFLSSAGLKDNEILRSAIETYEERALDSHVVYHNSGGTLIFHTSEGHYGLLHFLSFDKNGDYVTYFTHGYLGDSGSILFSLPNTYIQVRDWQYMEFKSVNIINLQNGENVSPNYTPRLSPFTPEVDGVSYFQVNRELYQLDAFNLSSTKFSVVDDVGLVWMYAQNDYGVFVLTGYIDGGEEKGRAESVQFIGDKHMLITFSSGIVARYDTENGRYIWSSQVIPEDLKSKVFSDWDRYFRSAVSPNGEYFVVSRDGFVILVDAESAANLSEVIDLRVVFSAKVNKEQFDEYKAGISVNNAGGIKIRLWKQGADVLELSRKTPVELKKITADDILQSKIAYSMEFSRVTQLATLPGAKNIEYVPMTTID